MAKLVGEDGRLAGISLEMIEGEEWSIGRDPDEAMLILEDPSVSRRHAICRQTPAGLLLENLSESNPLSINGRELIEPQLLVEGDQVKIGDTLFRFTAKTGAESGEGLEYEEFLEEPTSIGGQVDLAETGRWLVKVVTGPNTGAELALHAGRTYTLGTDPATCEIVFHDLSVSRQHARLTIADDETVTIEDIHSRNGVVVDGETTKGVIPLRGNQVISVGTSSFVLIDREEAQETLMSAAPKEKQEEAPPEMAVEKKKERPVLSGGAFILMLVAVAVIVIAVAGSVSLFREDDVVTKHRDYDKELATALTEFHDVRFTYNPATGKLFLLGHVLTPVDKSELVYNLDGLHFIEEVEDNVVVDQYIWEEYNAIISKNPEWVGVNMYSPVPGTFVLSGYLARRTQKVTLQDYLSVNFPYVGLLEDQVVVEEVLIEAIQAKLIGAGFSSVGPELANGQVTLTGFIGRGEAKKFERAVNEVKGLQGVRQVRNFVVLLADEQSVVDLTGRYNVQGFSVHDDATVNVLIDGRILARGDTFEGMEVVSIKSNAIILEKDGVKYKINYDQS